MESNLESIFYVLSDDDGNLQKFDLSFIKSDYPDRYYLILKLKEEYKERIITYSRGRFKLSIINELVNEWIEYSKFSGMKYRILVTLYGPRSKTKNYIF